MNKGLRVLIALLCAVSFGVCGFAVYKVVDTGGFSRSSAPAASVAEAPLSDQAVIVPADAASQPVPAQQAAAAQQTADSGTVTSYSGNGVSWEMGEIRSQERIIAAGNDETRLVYCLAPLQNTGNTDIYFSMAYPDFLNDRDQVLDSAGRAFGYYAEIRFVPEVIGPGETAWLLATYAGPTAQYRFDLGRDQIASMVGAQKSPYPVRRFPTSVDSFYLGDPDKDYYLKSDGTVENNTGEDIPSRTRIAVLLFDGNDNCIGMVFKMVGAMHPGEREEFSADNLGYFGFELVGPIPRYEVFAYPENS